MRHMLALSPGLEIVIRNTRVWYRGGPNCWYTNKQTKKLGEVEERTDVQVGLGTWE